MLPIGDTDPVGPPGPNTPQISLQDINVELKNAATAPITLQDTRVLLLAGKTAGAIIKMSDFYGKYCRTVYRATTYNSTAGANANAYNGGDGESFNAEANPTHTDFASTDYPTVGTYTFSGKPTTSVAGSLRVAAKKVIIDDGGSVPPPSTIGATLSYSTDGTNWYSMGTLTTSVADFYASITANPNVIQVRVTGASASGGSLKLGTDYIGHTRIDVYDIIFAV